MPAHHKILVHDTTLRDGEQMSGVAFAPEEKLVLAEKVTGFGADLIDIMPAVSPAEFGVTKELITRFGAKISPTCRMKLPDIDELISTGASRITLFAPMSDLHISQKLKITREENLRRSLEMIDYAKSHGLIVDFAGEDSSRADIGYFASFLKEIDGKIALFFIADTVGCLTPESARKMVWFVKNNFRCSVGLHMHNDFGMATANTVEGILAGADCFSGTFTGIGERAGNAPIEEVCAALKYLCGKELFVDYHRLKEICDMVQEFSRVKLQRHKPIVGENAFSHESGIHVDGILKNPKTYEFIEPESVGQKRSIRIGKHSGKKALQHLFGDELPDQETAGVVLAELKELALKQRGTVSKEEITQIISQVRNRKIEVPA